MQTHKIQFRTSAKWNLTIDLAIILECLFVLFLKENHRQEKHLFRNLKNLTEHLLNLLLCLFTGEWVFCKCEPELVLVGFTHIGYCHSGGTGMAHPWQNSPPLAKQPRKQDALRRPSQLFIKQTAVQTAVGFFFFFGLGGG